MYMMEISRSGWGRGLCGLCRAHEWRRVVAAGYSCGARARMLSLCTLLRWAN